ncbi:hypothetical protein HALA3H3_p20068 [Halomonas sp. A3H3]|nr:hypothetical protein HALA3H3_p20068 [Halomonas sp. A3H3]
MASHHAGEPGPLGHGVEDGAELPDVVVQPLQALVALVSIDPDLIVDAFHAGWSILAYPVEADLHAPQLELEDGRDALDALEHAAGECCHQQLRGVEGVEPAGQVGVEGQGGRLAAGLAAVGVEASGADLEGHLGGGFVHGGLRQEGATMSAPPVIKTMTR